MVKNKPKQNETKSLEEFSFMPTRKLEEKRERKTLMNKCSIITRSKKKMLGFFLLTFKTAKEREKEGGKRKDHNFDMRDFVE